MPTWLRWWRLVLWHRMLLLLLLSACQEHVLLLLVVLVLLMHVVGIDGIGVGRLMRHGMRRVAGMLLKYRSNLPVSTSGRSIPERRSSIRLARSRSTHRHMLHLLLLLIGPSIVLLQHHMLVVLPVIHHASARRIYSVWIDRNAASVASTACRHFRLGQEEIPAQGSTLPPHWRQSHGI